MNMRLFATICVSCLCLVIYNLTGIPDIDAGKVMVKSSGGPASTTTTTAEASTTTTAEPTTTTTTATEYSFGYTGDPATTLASPNSAGFDEMRCTQYQSDAHAGTVTKMSIWTGYEYTTDTGTFTVAVYANNATPDPDTPGTLLGQSGTKNNDDYDINPSGWHDITGGTLTSASIESSTLYWLCVWVDGGTTDGLQYGYTSTGGLSQHDTNCGSYSTWPEPPSTFDATTEHLYALKCYYEG